MIRRLAALLLALPACVVQYTVGTGADADTASSTETTCPEGQIPCDGGCAPSCDPCDTQAPCDTPTGDGDGGESDTGDGEGGETCGDGLVACGDGCATPEDCACAGACDPNLEVCSDGTCACRPGLTRCGETCVDLRTDPLHCGDCDLACNGGVCQNSSCREGCAADLATCDGACVETSTDSLHCGDCATLCASDEVCLAGTCRAYAAADGCDACPCPACGDGAPVCCPAPFLGVPVCVDVPCTGE